MVLFKRKQDDPHEGKQASVSADATPVLARNAYCFVCKKDRTFSTCWVRNSMLRQCMCCKKAFNDPEALYKRNQPVCPACGEFLEHPGFEYGVCDTCHSKFEFVTGAKSCLLPNKKQRDSMNQVGRSWSHD